MEREAWMEIESELEESLRYTLGLGDVQAADDMLKDKRQELNKKARRKILNSLVPMTSEEMVAYMGGYKDQK